ncbi:hypothetical protein BH10BDE1_BH10BDE1_22680 [soil metagenome]
MLKSLVSSFVAAAAVLTLSQSAQAEQSPVVLMAMPAINSAVVQAQAGTLGLKWKVGDTADYSMSAGFISGTIHSFVRDDNGTEIWVQQDMDLGFAGKQKIEILFDKATGQVKKLLADGKEQTLPDASNMEVVEQKEDTVTVPAGTFQAIYVKIKNKDDGKMQEAWINPKEVPINGMLKVLADSQLGQVKQELTSKTFAP